MGKVGDIKKCFQIAITFNDNLSETTTAEWIYRFKDGGKLVERFAVSSDADIHIVVDEIIKKAQEAIAKGGDANVAS